MMNENTQDRALLSSYYKLVNLQDAVKSAKIEAIETARNSFIADFESKSRKPTPALKRFWQKIKNKLFGVQVSRDKYSNITPSKKSLSNVDLSSPSNSSPLLTELETRFQAPINNPSSRVRPKEPPLSDVKQKSADQIPINNTTALNKSNNHKPVSSKDISSELSA